jgi:hypothetical protein
MTQAMPTSSTGRFLTETTVFTDAPGDTRAAFAHAERLDGAAEQLRLAIVRDALHGGADWWEVADMLATHPQAAFDACAHLVDHRPNPAEQRPDLAVVLTAGWPLNTTWSSSTGSASPTWPPITACTPNPRFAASSMPRSCSEPRYGSR